MNDIRAASQVAVQAGQEGIALSEETTRSARDIALVTQQQRKATEQVGQSMDDMAATVTDAMAQNAPDRRQRGRAGRGGVATGHPGGQWPVDPACPGH